MSARSNRTRKRNRGSKPILLKRELVPDQNTEEMSSENEFYSKGFKRLLYILILLAWSWMFYYAPVYLGTHTPWVLNMFQILGGLCFAGIMAIAYPFINKYIHETPPEELIIPTLVLMSIFCIYMYYTGGEFDPKQILKPGIKDTRIVVFILAFLLIACVIYMLPAIVYMYIYKVKTFTKTLTVKNVVAFILAILTILTAIFQFLQVLLPLLASKH